MDILKSLQSVIDTLQQVMIPATYGNVNKMDAVYAELVKIGDAITQAAAQQRTENKQPENNGMGG